MRKSQENLKPCTCYKQGSHVRSMQDKELGISNVAPPLPMLRHLFSSPDNGLTLSIEQTKKKGCLHVHEPSVASHLWIM